MIKHTKFYQIGVLISCFALLASCGTAPTKTSPQKPSEAKPSVEQAKTTSANEYIKRANNSESVEQAVIWYVRAADAYLYEQAPNKALAILSELNTSLMSEFIQQQYLLFKAEAYIEFKQYAQAYPLIKSLDLIQGFEPRLLNAKAIAATKTQHYLSAAKTRIKLKKWLTDNEQIQQQNDFIWQDLVHLETAAFNFFQEPDQAEFSGWLELLKITEQNANSPANMLLKVKQWQAQYPSHPAAKQLPNGLQLALLQKPYKPEHIAVILPLSGPFLKQGQAIQQGISASYFEQKLSHSPKITYLDSNKLDWSNLTTLEVDFIIGPLLKDNIKKFQQAQLSTPVLYLNELTDIDLAQPEVNKIDVNQPLSTKQALASSPSNNTEKQSVNKSVNKNEALSTKTDAKLTDAKLPNQDAEATENVAKHFSFTLSPEVEAKQAAQKMFELGYQKPIVFAANNSYGKRMSDAFIETYKDLNDNVIELSFFSNTQEMESSVTRLMETQQSKDRIKTMRSLLGRGVKFESDARNRRDIDAIYIIGDPTQTRILKPYIDVNTSPFAPIIPIYASSLSYSSKLNNADLRDLNQIIFSDMPWILPGRANRNKLAHQMQLAWRNTNDQLSRLFAFGFDAYQLIPHLAQMTVFPTYHLAGMTGELQLNANQQIERTLKWAKFDHGRVTNLALKKPAQ